MLITAAHPDARRISGVVADGAFVPAALLRQIDTETLAFVRGEVDESGQFVIDQEKLQPVEVSGTAERIVWKDDNGR